MVGSEIMITDQLAMWVLLLFFGSVFFYFWALPLLKRTFIDPCAKGHNFKYNNDIYFLKSPPCSLRCATCGFIKVLGDKHEFETWKDGERKCRACLYVEIERNCHKCGIEMQDRKHEHRYGGRHFTRHCPNCEGKWCNKCGRNQLYERQFNDYNENYIGICMVCREEISSAQTPNNMQALARAQSPAKPQLKTLQLPSRVPVPAKRQPVKDNAVLDLISPGNKGKAIMLFLEKYGGEYEYAVKVIDNWLDSGIVDACSKGDRINAMKIYRKRCGCSLQESKIFIDSLFK
jgi:hypothetical protein